MFGKLLYVLKEISTELSARLVVVNDNLCAAFIRRPNFADFGSSSPRLCFCTLEETKFEDEVRILDPRVPIWYEVGPNFVRSRIFSSCRSIAGAFAGTPEGSFSALLESVRKDIECVFGIMKKRYRMLKYGIRFRNMLDAEKLFVCCAILHNMDLPPTGERGEPVQRLGNGIPLVGEGIWIERGSPHRRLGYACHEKKQLVQAWRAKRNALIDHNEGKKKRARLSTMIVPVRTATIYATLFTGQKQ